MRDTTLIEVTFVTDDETGMYRIGEMDHRIHVQELEDYLRHHGSKPVIEELTFLIDYVRRMEAEQKEG